jgi:hypothetical protein
VVCQSGGGIDKLAVPLNILLALLRRELVNIQSRHNKIPPF